MLVLHCPVHLYVLRTEYCFSHLHAGDFINRVGGAWDRDTQESVFSYEWLGKPVWFLFGNYTLFGANAAMSG